MNNPFPRMASTDGRRSDAADRKARGKFVSAKNRVTH
jgi:hypothetical protein